MADWNNKNGDWDGVRSWSGELEWEAGVGS